MAKLLTPAQRARKVREVYLSLPDTEETPTWGSPHFRVAGKIFGGLGEEKDGRTTIGLKLEMDHADALVASDPRFTRAPYVGHKGWVRFDVTQVVDYREVELLVRESYRLIAPKRTLAKLTPGAAESKKPSKRALKAGARSDASPAHKAKRPPPKRAAKKSASKRASAAGGATR